MLYSHHISALIVDIILNTLGSHPSYGDPLLIFHHALPPAEVVSAIYVFCKTKVSYFDHSTAINPAYVKCFQSLVPIITMWSIHAISCSQITMNKLLLSKICHSLCYLMTHFQICPLCCLYLQGNDMEV